MAFATLGLVAGPAVGAPLASASFSMQIESLPPAVFPGAGAMGTATSNLGATLSAGTAFNGAFTTTLPTTAAPPFTAIQVFVTKNGAGSFTGATPGQVRGNGSIEGVANLYALGGFTLGGAPLLSVPLNVGTPNTIYKVQSGVAMTIIGASWTAATATVTGDYAVTAMGSNALTPGGSGTLLLVAPAKVITDAFFGTLAGFGTLTLTYVPEPGTLLLCGLGVAALAAARRRQR